MGDTRQPVTTSAAQSDAATRRVGEPRSARLLRLIAESPSAIIVTHDNPDPDAIASGWALHTLIRERLGLPVRLVAGGAVLRAENLLMVELLKPPMELVNRLEVSGRPAAVLVDCSPHGINHLLKDAQLQPLAVIDHHRPTRERIRVRFRDIRPSVAATATIISQYFREQGLEPRPELATALVYAMRTDMQAAGGSFSRADRQVMAWLMLRADHEKLNAIENAPLPQGYYADLSLALQNTFIYDDVAICFLPRASGPEIIAEVADLLIRCQGVCCVLCGAMVEDSVLFSARAVDEKRDASALMQRTLNGLGYGGGHRHRAGGRISTPDKPDRLTADLQATLKSRWLTACGVEPQRGSRLVPRCEILEHL
ncbi:MAG: hypothetical protein AMXMBFR13_22880 [Phycisphaerae bacterium]